MFNLPVVWSAPKYIKSLTTTRKGGVSEPPFDSFNIAYHVNDKDCDVTTNRTILQQEFPNNAIWLEQIHSNKVITITANSDLNRIEQADALFTKQLNTPLAIMTADCLPILLTDLKGKQIAAIHGGWRGLAGGIIENTIQCFDCDPANILAWLGPAIGPENFEVGQDVFDAFSGLNKDYSQGFKSKGKSKFFADIFFLAKALLNKSGVSVIACEQDCTFKQSELFYSYRREGKTGRMASVIWISEQ